MLAPRARYGEDAAAAAGLLIHGDNLAAMQALLRDGVTVDLAIIDPPFATGDAFSFALPIGEGDEIHRAPAYSDRWPGGIGGFLAMLDPRLRLLHRLLASDGSLYVHLDPTVAHPVKILLDEIFGPACFQREIIWRIGWISGFKSRVHNWVRNHDTILFYVKDPRRFTFNKRYIPYPPGYRRRDGKAPRGPGIPIDDVWNAGPGDLELRGADSLDSIQIRSFSREKTGWATQKNESLLRRIIEASSKPGDRIIDVFCGAGTTLAAAAALGRRWIGCDRAAMAIHLARKRLREADVAFVLAEVSEVSEVSAEVSEVSPAPVLRVDAEAGRLEVEWVGECGLAELHAAAAEARGRGLGRLVLLADRWGFALAEACAPEERRAAALRGLEITCLYRRQILPEEPALPRPALEVHGEGAGPWGFFLEIGGYRPHCTASLPDPTLAPRIRRWDEWLDGWALALGDAGPFAPCVERYRSRRQRALPCRTAEPVVIPAGERRGQVHGVLEVVDILGLATRWPLTLGFDGDGRLLGVGLGIERLAEASGLA